MNSRPAGSKTAAELIAELEADPDYVARRDEAESQRQRSQIEWRRAEAPLTEQLRQAGFEVDSAWDLVNTSSPYPEALPILLAHLGRPYPDRVREGIARALAVRDAKFAWGDLIKLYRHEKVGTGAKDGLAVALAAASDDSSVDDVIALARDPVHGDSRLLLLRGLARSRVPEAHSALEEFTQDPVLGEEASALLKR